MDTLLKETVDTIVNSRYPGMSSEGRKLLKEVLVRKEIEKARFCLKKGKSATIWFSWAKA